MFAVIKTGGKQYKVVKDDLLTVEKLAAEAGEKVQFNEVLMLGTGADVTVGTPVVVGAGVVAEVVEQTRGEKVISFKKRRRKHNSQRKKGHRQHLTVVRVTDILASNADASGVKAAVGAGAAGLAMVAAAAPAAASNVTAAATVGTKPTNLLSEPKGKADDLEMIGGVGPKLAALLNANGVFHFWQIAQWTPAEVAFIDSQLKFKGRIERDEWIEQAKELMAGKPPRAASDRKAAAAKSKE